MKKQLTSVIFILSLFISSLAWADNQTVLIGLGMKPEVAFQLDKLYGSALTTTMKPATDNAIDLGSASKEFRSIYVGTSIVNAGLTTQTGDLTIATQAKGLVAGEAVRAANVSTITNQGAALYLSTPGASGDLAALISSGVSATGARVDFFKTRATSGQASTIVNSGDEIAFLRFWGSDGTGYDAAAAIKVTVDGTPGATTDMPGAIDFQTSPDGSATLASVLKLTNDKLATFSGGIKSTATNLGWAVRTGANTACNTTCTASHGCAFGFDTGTTAVVDCSSALADSCVCSF